MREATQKVVEVALGVLVVDRGQGPRVLIARRPADRVLGGCWEFPGGKVEPDESPREAVLREMTEELGVQVRVTQALEPVEHRYAHGRVRLWPFLCELVRGQPQPLEAVQCRLVRPRDLGDYRFPPANQPLVAELVRRLERPTSH